MPEQQTPGSSGDGTTWVVLSIQAGNRLAEYVHGDRAVREADGSLSVFQGAKLIRRFAAGAWESYAEWVTAAWSALGRALPSMSLPGQRDSRSESAESSSAVGQDRIARP
jgi:hypothetical protein